MMTPPAAPLRNPGVSAVNRFVALIAFISLFATAAHAQDDPHAACAAPPSYVPAELLVRTVPLRSGVGNSHERVTTTSKEAQAFYDQGLNYLESYVWAVMLDKGTFPNGTTSVAARLPLPDTPPEPSPRVDFKASRLAKNRRPKAIRPLRGGHAGRI